MKKKAKKKICPICNKEIKAGMVLSIDSKGNLTHYNCHREKVYKDKKDKALAKLMTIYPKISVFHLKGLINRYSINEGGMIDELIRNKKPAKFLMLFIHAKEKSFDHEMQVSCKVHFPNDEYTIGDFLEFSLGSIFDFYRSYSEKALFYVNGVKHPLEVIVNITDMKDEQVVYQEVSMINGRKNKKQ